MQLTGVSTRIVMFKDTDNVPASGNMTFQVNAIGILVMPAAGYIECYDSLTTTWVAATAPAISHEMVVLSSDPIGADGTVRSYNPDVAAQHHTFVGVRFT